MALQAADILDIVTGTLANLGADKITFRPTDIQKHIAMQQFIGGGNKKLTMDGGKAINYQFMHTHSGNFRWTGIRAQDSTNVTDVAVTATVPWRHCHTSWSVSSIEISINAASAQQIVDIVKLRQMDAMTGLAEGMETAFWGKPTSSSDTLNPWGVGYWLPWADETAEAGGGDYTYSNGVFSDALPSGFTDIAGVDVTSATYKRLRHWVFSYTNVSKDDLILKVKTAAYKTNFSAPQAAKLIPDYSTGDDCGYYTTWVVSRQCETLLEAQNENLGSDLDAYGGMARFHKRPIVPVPKLDQSTAANSNPIYGIQWGVFKPVFLRGRLKKRTGPMVQPGQHNDIVTYEDYSLNFVCYDRHINFVGAVSAPY